MRQQLSHTTPSSSSTLTHSPNWYATLSSLLRSEGPRAVYKGLSASLVREGSYSAIRMGGYDSCKGVISAGLTAVGVAGGGGDANANGGLAVKLGGGMASGMCGAAVANPADLVSLMRHTLPSEEASGS